MYEGDDEYQEARLEFLAEQAKFKTMFEVKVKTQGYRMCRFIPRNGLAEMSLMTEIVRFDTSSLFKHMRQHTTRFGKIKIGSFMFKNGGGAQRERLGTVPRHVSSSL